MRFIEIADGVSVKKCEVLCVMRLDEFRSKVVMEYGEYESNFSYGTMLKLLEMDNGGDDDSGNSPTTNIYPRQFFAG